MSEETCGEDCGDNRFEIIESAKRELLHRTNIESSPDEMSVLDSILFRLWQMRWLPGCKPKRNCDVGTVKEQSHRFDRLCNEYLLNRDEDEECVGCPLVNMAGHCELNWAQMPYEAEEEKEGAEK